MASPNDRDFSSLPDVVWVNVMARLDMVDRNNISRTCSRLNGAFHHPSLWHTVRIVLMGELEDGQLQKFNKLRHGVIVPERYVAMIQAFGAFFQDVRLVILGYVREIKQPCQEVITQLAKNCRLESLTLEIGEPVNVGSGRKPPTEEDLRVIGSLVSEAFRLKSLAVISWPIYTNQKGFDLLKVMRENTRIKDLERLRLFEREAGYETWFPRNTSLPARGDVQMTVGHFKRLASLGLHADLLTESLMLALMELKFLNHLSLLLIQSTSSKIENIASSSWANLVAKRPNLKVTATLGNTLPSYDFIQFFKSEIPLASVSFSKYSRYQTHQIEHLSASYAKTLSVFRDFGDELVSGDAALVSMVTRCKQMNHFIFAGKLKDSTILALAELRREDWATFQVRLQSHSVPEDDDDNKVIGATSTGEVYVKAHQPNSDFYYTDESQELRQATLETLIDKVSKILQRKWLPIQ